MKKLVLTLGAMLALAAAQVHAETVLEDSDGNGVYSMEELAAAYPGLSEETFAAIDTDGDGAVSPEELGAAIDAGVIGE
ncbi:EF-hand domain-containing protein [Acidimangrovimonas pyrenivorans]|uniref:EF-hand domain-containing protein n=1 Tax=Acidimangrovimonas pyrenivorans TaxID=2030798 RepID=A0ABV7AHJ7_9RHOB